jgi:hypothetical protein
MTIAKDISFREKLYAEKEFVDLKILCNGKQFKCHKIVLSCQSEVFKTMIKNKSLTEKKTRIMKIEENDISYVVMGRLLYFCYHDKVKNDKMINPDLLLAADKYNIQGLLDECCKHFESKLSLQNALDILVLAETTNQKNLFATASRFVGKNLGSLEKSSAYQEMVNDNPKMFTRVFSKMLEVKEAPKRGRPVQATGLNGVEFESSSDDSSSDDSSSDDE